MRERERERKRERERSYVNERESEVGGFESCHKNEWQLWSDLKW